MSAICMAAGALCLIYYMIIVAYAGITADFAWIWIAAAVALGGGSLLLRYGKLHPGFYPGWLKYAVVVILAAGFLLFLFLCTKVVQGMTSKGSADLDYVVVLGAQVKKETPSRALKKRLEKALEYAENNPETILILSGGQGSGEEITEAECMSRYLIEHGIPKERLVLEERSTSTKENLEFSNELTGCADAKTGILSNNFHVYRAVKLAEKQGYLYPEGIAAKSDPIMQAHYVVREAFALVKERLKGNIR
ncbi:MAG: YdcF family protein [Eubacteriales bacterium]|nr:YdcF family protein [Eubacteriales bacterium]